MVKINHLRRLLPYVLSVGSAKTRRTLMGMIPHAGVRQMKNIIDVLHRRSVEIYEAKKRALEQGDEAVVHQIGEGKDIHPRNKQDVGKRLARWALARDYGVNVPAQSPTYKSMEKTGGKITLTFDHVDGGFRPFDTSAPVGFAIAGADRKFVWADAKITGPNTVEVWSDKVADPAAVRYAWADNPEGANLYNRAGLPASTFRTDDY